MTTRALIIGVSGQDGSYLAQHLAEQGYEVWGTLRGQPEAHPRYDWLRALIADLQLIGMDLADAGSIRDAITIVPFDEIYHLAAVSSPGQAWEQPVLTGDITGLGVTRLLDAVHANPATRGGRTKVLIAGSLATHGPYGAAKLYARAVAADYRHRGEHVSVAVFGGHHSPRRSPVYFSRKVTRAVARIVAGLQGNLILGSLARVQDWGWAQDFVTVLPVILQGVADDYVVSTGQPHSCHEWVEAAFKAADLDWYNHVLIDEQIGNVTDVPSLTAKPDPRLTTIGWQPRQDFEELVTSMVLADFALVNG